MSNGKLFLWMLLLLLFIECTIAIGNAIAEIAVQRILRSRVIIIIVERAVLLELFQQVKDRMHLFLVTHLMMSLLLLRQYASLFRPWHHHGAGTSCIMMVVIREYA